MMRKIIQWVTALGTNSYIQGFIQGRIFKGATKQFCVPGLNCYSCPGAWGACPIGSLQAVIGSFKYKMSFYVTGLMMAYGLAFGRAICGFLCPFGLIQELIYKIPFKRIKSSRRQPKYLKYAVLIIFVIAMPLVITNRMGIGAPAFCKYICPSGTLTAGIPLLSADPNLRQAIGSLFALKSAVLAATILGSLMIYRFFCKYLCPLGAIYSLFNGISIYRLHLDEDKCTNCGVCTRACKMNVNPSRRPNDPECIRCGDCVKACKFNALSAGVKIQQKEKRLDIT